MPSHTAPQPTDTNRQQPQEQPSSHPAHSDWAQRLVNLDAWLETMYQQASASVGYAGYGGPVAHWWQNRFRYAGAGFDWRYEGLLIAYAELYAKTQAQCWLERLERASADVMRAQLPNGHYPASRFEINPGTVGTPHEAAATLGLITASPYVADSHAALAAAKANLDALIAALWDDASAGFNDRPGVLSRVPNKLATLAQALLAYVQHSGDESYLPYAQAALDDVLRFQLGSGRWRGAVHQYADASLQGDGRFFPYYNARCVPPLCLAAKMLSAPRYAEAAMAIMDFLQATMHEDGSWDQIIYASGALASWPRWLAGSADILLAFVASERALPELSLRRLLSYQLASGAFPTAQGFAQQIRQRPAAALLNHRDVLPVVGWNDKVLRLLATLLPSGQARKQKLPSAHVHVVDMDIMIAGRPGRFYEDAERMLMLRGSEAVYRWNKTDVWAALVSPLLEVR